MTYALLSYRQEGFCFWEYVKAFLRFGEDPEVPLATGPRENGKLLRLPVSRHYPPRYHSSQG